MIVESSSMSIKRQLELGAAHTVAQVLGGTPESRDKPGPGALDGTHDFDIHLPGGGVVALEVTTAANKAMIGTTAAMRKLRDAKWPELTHSWGLTGRHPENGADDPRINEVVKRGNRLLAQLEQAGVQSSTISTATGYHQ